MDRSSYYPFLVIRANGASFSRIYFLLWQLLHAPHGNQCIYPRIKPEHVVSFGDAVFAFAITLMTPSIDIPDLPLNLTELQLLSKLYDMYPQVESYIISFAVIAAFSSGFHIIRFSILLKDLIF